MNMTRTSRGYFTLLVLVFAAVFFTLVSALAGFIFVEKRANLAEENRQKALNIAEAGLEYYKWHLAHFPNDLQDGTNHAGPYAHAYQDPASGTIGTFSLDIQGQNFCGSVNSVTITSTGWSVNDASYKRILIATYARPSVADYSTIVDANVWAGADRIIQGPYHSNGGIRMDGTHNAPVTSGVATWICTSQFGCSGNQTQNGVFGAGSNPSLWNYPVPPVDFNGITVDLTHLKGYATSSGGVYLAPSSNYGWYLTFNSNGTFTAKKVTSITTVWGYSTDTGWVQENSVMAGTGSPTTYTIPATCPVVFAEDNVWVDGVVSGKVVLAAADVTNANVDRSVILNGNLTNANQSGDGITVIGENNNLVGLATPDTMTIRGIFIAQKGKFGRNHYEASGTHGLPSALDGYVTRSVLNTFGTVVSKGRVGTKWTSGSPPVFVSGYAQRNDSFDRALSAAPPPFTPSTSSDFIFKSWQEQ
jgi:hypothetical protein